VNSDFGTRARFFSREHFQRGNILTTTIVATTVAVFLVQLYYLYVLHSDWFSDTFALSHQGLKAGHYWQLVTYAWLHSERLIIHILFNMLIVYSLGRALEWPLGPLRFLGLYFGAAVAAAITWLIWGASDAGIEGASGAAFGLVAAYAVHDPRRVLRVWVMMVLPIQMTARTLALVLVGFEALCQLNGWFPSIGHTAHLGGAFFGWIYMRWLKRTPPPEIGAFSDYKSTPQPPGTV